jgi:diketogulonate reductase-like aldo/keto reductase
VVPRTSKVNRMEENLALFAFDLSDQDMQRLDALDGGGKAGAGDGDAAAAA